MEGNERRPARGGSSRGIVAWLRRNRDDILRDVVAGLLLVVVLTALSRSATDVSVELWVFAAVVVAAISAGGYLGDRRQRRKKLGVRYRAYFEQMRSLLEKGLGEGLVDLERELLVNPARLIQDRTGFPVQLFVFEPVEPEEGPAHWRIRFRAGISDSECRDFEVPLQDSFIALMLRRTGNEVVSKLDDLDRPETSGVTPGADIAAFRRAGFRSMRCVRSQGPSSPSEITTCLVMLSREKLPNGTEDAYLTLLSRFLGIHFELTGMAEQVEAYRRRLSDSEEGEGPDGNIR